MAYQLETPFDNIESAHRYVNQLLAATREAQAEIETELRCVTDPEVARREQALQLVKYKLSQLTSHLSSSHRILNDLTKLRRFLLEAPRAEHPLLTPWWCWQAYSSSRNCCFVTLLPWANQSAASRSEVTRGTTEAMPSHRRLLSLAFQSRCLEGRGSRRRMGGQLFVLR